MVCAQVSLCVQCSHALRPHTNVFPSSVPMPLAPPSILIFCIVQEIPQIELEMHLEAFHMVEVDKIDWSIPLASQVMLCFSMMMSMTCFRVSLTSPKSRGSSATVELDLNMKMTYKFTRYIRNELFCFLIKLWEQYYVLKENLYFIDCTCIFVSWCQGVHDLSSKCKKIIRIMFYTLNCTL